MGDLGFRLTLYGEKGGHTVNGNICFLALN
jgi:hypothetical protein